MADVKYDYDNRKAYITTDKRKGVYTVKVGFGKFPHYIITTETGSLPEELSGTFTTIRDAVRVFEEYERKTTKSRTVKRDEWQEEKEAKRAQLSSKDS